MTQGVDALNKQDARSRARSLREEIARHDHLYYAEDDPEISDAEYDALMEELAAIEERWPDLVTRDSPTQRVGAPPKTELGTLRHETPMLSLRAIDREESFRHFWEDTRERLGRDHLVVVAEPKFDGASIEVTWDRGRYVSAATRGDGATGEDVTANVRTIGSVPLRLRSGEGTSVPRHLVARGEVHLDKEAFAELNRRREQAGERAFANPRNAAAGALRQLDLGITAERPLSVFFWEIASSSSRRPKTQGRSLALLERLGLPVNEERTELRSADAAVEWYERMSERREELPYEIDGCVFKVDDLDAHETLGTRASNPRWAVAWKFPPERKTTRIRRIEAQVGRTGVLTPVAILEPVHLAGVEVSHVSLHNPDEIERKDVRVGDYVLVERAGDVIPHLVRVIERRRSGGEKRWRIPRRCPACGGRVTRPEGDADARCTNAACPAQRQELLKHFGSKGALDIDGLGDVLARQLTEEGLVEDVADLLALEEDALVDLERLGRRSARNLLEEIDAARKQVTLPRLLFGLGIPHVGEATADLLARAFGSLDALLDADASDLAGLEDVGPTVAEAIAAWCAERGNRRLVRRLKRAGLDPRAKRRGTRLQDLTVVFTGELDAMTRDEAEAAVRDQGGRATSSVSSNTDYLVVGEDPGGSKREDARRHGTPVLDEREFLDLLGRG